jgi:NFU1 iron-sulfur cluster scaffold homolog, mitochondrial
METTTSPWVIYAEATPNPSSMKFVANRVLIPNNSLEFTDPSQTKESPLAAEIFKFSFVKGVFITQNFVTIQKTDTIEWNDVLLIVREFLKNYLENGGKIISEKPDKNSTAAGTQVTAPGVDPESLTETERKIVSLLDEYIRPAVEGDGGAISFKSFQDGVVTVVMQGSCSGCPSSTMTLKAGIEGLLRRMVPEVNSVVAES